MNFRTLRADEIECRVSQINEKGLALLLYKNARVDMDILDETVGAENWQRAHFRDNANCAVSIWNGTQWVSKEDTGTESNTEAEKGLASDSFKRACVNWGIGRELYSAPFVWINAKDCTITQGRNGKPQCYDRFSVAAIEYDERRRISSLAIRNNKTGKICFEWYGAILSKNVKNAPQNATKNVTAPPVPEKRDFRADLVEVMDEITGGDPKNIATGLHYWSGGAYTTVEQIPDAELPKFIELAENHYSQKHGGVPYVYKRKEN